MAKGKYARKTSGGGKKNAAILAICIAAAVLVVLAAVMLWMLYQRSPDVQTMGNVTAAGVDLRGMTVSQAETVLRSATENTYTGTSMVIQVQEEQVSLSPGDTGARLDVSAVIEAARQYTGKERQILDILPYLTLDRSVVEKAVRDLGTRYNAELVPSTCRLEGTLPGSAGAGEASDAKLVITLGTPGYQLDAQALLDQVMMAYNNNVFQVTAQCTIQEPEPLDLEALHREYSLAPVNAVMDKETFQVTPHTVGYEFDLEAAKALLEGAEDGQTVEIPIVPLMPEVTEESLSGLLFRDVLASQSTKHTNNSNRNTNLTLACQAINGKVINPGETFSYNDTLGRRTSEKGYKPAGAYVNGQTVDVVGGGICQVATTLYYCALLSDLEIVDRECHMYVPSYIDYGMDATINWGTIDFQFRNNTEYPIRIEASVSDGYVHVSLIGTDTKDYYVKMEYVVNSKTAYQTTYREMYADNPEGYEDGDVIVTPYTGYSVDTYRCKYSKETDALISRSFEDNSRYSKRDQVICRIVEKPTEPPVEPPTEPPIGGGIIEDPGD